MAGLTKKQIVDGLREQRADLIAKRDRLDVQIEQAEAALAAYGVSNPRGPRAVDRPQGRQNYTLRSAEDRAQDRDRILEHVRMFGGITVADASDLLGLANGSGSHVLTKLLDEGVLTRSMGGGAGKIAYVYTLPDAPKSGAAGKINPATKLPNAGGRKSGESVRLNVQT